MRAFVFQVKLDTWKCRQGQTNKMRIRRALVVSVNFINGIFNPIATHH
ncbi:hypothetical protein CFSAN002064_18830 [Salmonella enterica subsp. enterica serovar Heidelberg str. CFSAN002064]|nr:hypothetical protein CFSAN002064_18830 [Salmonella enterica subsp. enterica serovar Heidelberg str. CFSAN002064]ETE47098.1 hypothetical protein M574_01050 [Salmonella enterica subsp. enterica serovar Infantis str. 335-3]